VIRRNKLIAIVRDKENKIIVKRPNGTMNLPYNLNVVNALLKHENIELIEVHVNPTLENLMQITAQLKIPFYFQELVDETPKNINNQT
jgi:hypothetical protein